MRSLVVWILAVLAACGSAPACPVVPRPASAPPFLWKVQKADGPVVWLYGTIHNAGEADVPPAAWAALESSPHFLSELGDTEPDRETTVELAKLPRGKGLDQQLPSDDWYDLRDALDGVIKEDDLKRARPWYAMARLTETIAPSPSPTMDFALARRARGRGMTVEPLERWEDQLRALADSVGVADLQQAIHARKTMRCELAQLKAVYATGDLAAMQKLLVIPATEKLLVDRNRAWLPALEAQLAQGGAFVAVGLGHLAGEHGLPALLEAAGYTVTRAR
ncbi:MAG TPA: TraB/GumN family protein [Kofleriaceae bacterium]|nr:TraB/GumN family protein [Kofleriaceae bacterium]